MSSAAFVNGLELVIMGGCALAGFRLWRTGLYKRYRALFGYLLFRFFFYLLAIFWFNDVRSASYQKFFILTQPLGWLFSVLVLRELYGLVLEKYRGLSTLGRWFVYAGLTISIV